MDNDLGFLLIFIILPTVLIVSGFWLILLVRKDSRIPHVPDRSQANTIPAAGTETVEGPLAKDTVPDAVMVREDTPATLDTELTSPEGAPFVADLDVPVDQSDDEEFWTEVPDEEPETAAFDEVSAEVVESEPQSGHTAEIVPVSPPPEPDDETDADAYLRADADDDPGEKESLQSGDTANLPEDWEVDLADDDEADESTRRRRQPEARLIPSTKHVRRRTGATTRRATQIPKSTGRDDAADEDAVESSDRS